MMLANNPFHQAQPAKDSDETWRMSLAKKKLLYGPNRVMVGNRPEVEPPEKNASNQLAHEPWVRLYQQLNL